MGFYSIRDCDLTGQEKIGLGPKSEDESGSSEPRSGCLNSAPPPVDEGTGTDSRGTGISGATAPRGSLAASASRGASFGSFTTERGEGVPWEKATGSDGSPTFSYP
ncbi:hypothetical protein LWI29_007540 [Acer saccharum]|uniref:Uncharacterized protein n=1 Tax=Acer saccharum TaxID=4024 RepID=A0AA39VY16_ACESA|nr:hypothetical protein LWI29_007540 [Acer saccharum]